MASVCESGQGVVSGSQVKGACVCVCVCVLCVCVRERYSGKGIVRESQVRMQMRQTH